MPQISADGPQSLQGTDRQPHAARNGLICAFVVVACLWASYPVAEMGFIDDWSYAKTAQVFAQTGHLAFNGGTAPMLGWQAVWGALFIKLFGFSFTVVRLSMLPVAMATIVLFHAILVRFGISARDAVLGTLTVGLSPIFIPLAVTYMSDVPGLFVVLLCLYLCQRAVAANSSNAAIGWLCLAASTNVAGGTVRQITWLGALVMVPSAGWLLRKRRGVLLTSSLLWVIGLASIFDCMRWYARRPYSLHDPVFKGPAFDASHPIFHFSFELLGIGLCFPLMLYPILVAWLPLARRLSRAALVRIALITLLWGLFERITGWTLPWLADVIWIEFDFPRMDSMLRTAQFLPMILPVWAREAASLLVIVTALIFVEYLCSKLRPRGENNPIHAASWQDAFWLLGPFTASYFVMLLLVAYHTILFDRYMLPIMPIAIVCLLKLHQEWIAPTLPAISVAVLGIFALLAIAGTHDSFAWSRARLAAINEIRASGVPRTNIQGGFEYDGWTQIEDGGYINDPWVEVPPGAYRPDVRQTVPDDCKFKRDSYTPDIHPRFTIIFPKMWCLERSEYPPVLYRTWLPPFKGTILVQKIPNAR